jgi:prepilin-type N-terminal cleavage/methylation domain-containing protein
MQLDSVCILSPKLLMLFHSLPQQKNRGFSFVELSISVAIFAFLSMVTVLSYNNFNNRIGVDILAHQIAQFGHEAQVNSLSVKRSNTGTYSGYGIHFERASTTQFIFFADNNANYLFDNNGSCGQVGDECEKKINLLQGVTISALCGLRSGPTHDNQPAECASGVSKDYAQSFDFMFRRPSPDASIQGKPTSVAVPESYSVAQVIISSNKNYKRTVEFWNTGQISVK